MRLALLDLPQFFSTASVAGAPYSGAGLGSSRRGGGGAGPELLPAPAELALALEHSCVAGVPRAGHGVALPLSARAASSGPRRPSPFRCAMLSGRCRTCSG